MLFNRNTNGQQEMKAILGFIYATNSFDNLLTDITLVEDDMKALLGKEIFAKIDEFYNGNHDSDDPDPDHPDHIKIWTELVKRTQAAIAFYAYRSYATHADLDHSDKGRKILSSDEQKPAFEWMIERDDKSLLAKAHKLTDRMLAYLDENKEDATIHDVWQASEAYKVQRSLFINSCSEFEKVYPINNSRRFYLKIVPFIRENEILRIKSILGETDFNALKSGIASDSLDADQKLIIELIKPPLALLSMITAIKRLNVDVLPEGIFQHITPETQTIRAAKPAPMEFINAVVRNLETEANNQLIFLQEGIAKRKAIADGAAYITQNLTSRNSPDNKHFRT